MASPDIRGEWEGGEKREVSSMDRHIEKQLALTKCP